MRIAILGPYPSRPGNPVGGVQAAVASLAESLDELGDHRVRVIDPFTGYVPIESSAVDVLRLPKFAPWRSGMTWVPRSLRRALADFDPDVLHVHLGAQYTRAHAVSVLTIHGFPHLETRLRNPGWRGKVASHILAPPFGSGVAHARKVIAISEEVTHLANAKGVASVHVPNPVARDFFRAERREVADFITVGDIMRRKNQALLIEAFELYVREGGPGNLILAGGVGDQSYYKECLEAAHKVAGRVIFVGPVSQQRLVALLSQARAFVSTSLRETSSIALAESLAANCPVVSLDVGTARLQVRSPEAGFVLPVRATATDVARALRQVSAMPAGTPRNLVMAQHPLAVARQTIEVYESSLSP